MVSFREIQRFFEKYKYFLYRAIVNLIRAISFHEEIYVIWLRKLSIPSYFEKKNLSFQ